MIVDHVWFSFQAGTDEPAELANIHRFLTDLRERSRIHGYRILKNRNAPPETRLSAYQASIEFRDAAQFGLPFAEVAHIGIHAGLHGDMIRCVADFHVEVFEDVP